MIKKLIELLQEPSLIEIVGSPDTGKTKLALQLTDRLLSNNEELIVGYIDTDQQLSIQALKQNNLLDRHDFYYFSGRITLPEKYLIDILIIDSLPIALQSQACKHFLFQAKNYIRSGKIKNIIILNQKRYNQETQQFESYYQKYVRRYCDFTFDLDTKQITQNCIEKLHVFHKSSILPNILNDKWGY